MRNAKLKFFAALCLMAGVVSATVTADAGSCWDWPAIFRKNARDPLKVNAKVLVLPYKNQTMSAQDEWLSDGFRIVLSEYLDLGHKVAVLNIIPSTIQDVETSAVMAIGEKAGADYVVTGHFNRKGNILNVSTKFVDTKKGEIQERLVTQVDLTAPKKMGELLNLIAQTTSDRLKKFRVKKNELAKNMHEINSLDAFRYYTLASMAWEILTPHNIKKASDLFQEALKQDYNYAAAYLGHARALLGLGFIEKLRGKPYRKYFQEARVEMAKAEALNEDFSKQPLEELNRYLQSDIHEVSANTFLPRRETGKAVKEFQRALDLLPGNVRAAHQLATL